jgi:hypothetical protein
VFECQNSDDVKQLSVDQYWKTIFRCKVANTTSRTPRFPNLIKCISFLFGLSTSNAVTERLFSALKLIKNDQRNRIHDFTIVSLLRIKYWLKNQTKTAKDVDIPDEMINAVLRVKQSATIKDYMGGIYDAEDVELEPNDDEDE